MDEEPSLESTVETMYKIIKEGESMKFVTHSQEKFLHAIAVGLYGYLKHIRGLSESTKEGVTE